MLRLGPGHCQLDCRQFVPAGGIEERIRCLGSYSRVPCGSLVYPFIKSSQTPEICSWLPVVLSEICDQVTVPSGSLLGFKYTE